MVNSKVEQLWNGTQCFGKLKVIDLSNSKDLRQTPNISGVPYLEELYLNDCTKLVEVHQSIRQHRKLEILSLIGCVNLKTFPSKLEMCSLKMLFLSDCSNVKRLPDFGKNMTHMSVLNLMHCKNLLCLPNSISNLKSLRILNISGCSKICGLPDGIKQNKDLEDLDLSRTAIGELDPSLLQLGSLKRLSLSGCGWPASNNGRDLILPYGRKFRFFPDHTGLILPPFFSGLSSLSVLDLSYCNLTDNSIPRDIDCLSSLERLILTGNNFIRLPAYYIANLSKLRYLELEDCPQLQSVPLLPPHVRLYVTHSDKGEANVVDPEKIWKLFESSNKELFQSPVSRRVVDYPYPVYMEIPSRFDNKRFFPLSMSYVSKFDSIASVAVDIPDDFRSSDGWGVAVFVAIEETREDVLAIENQFDKTKPVLEEKTCSGFEILFLLLLLFCLWFGFPNNTSTRQMRLCWNFDTLEPEDGPSLSLSSSSGANNDLYLFTMIVSGDFIYIRRHLRWERKFMPESFSKHRKPELKENSSLCFDVQVEGCKIRKCEWRMLHKEDYLEDLQKVNSSEIVVAPSNLQYSSGLSKSTVNENKGEDATASDVQNIEKSSENFSLVGKMVHNIGQGLGLSMLILMSMMIGATIFPLPVQGLAFKQHTTANEVRIEPLKSHWVSHRTALKVNTPQLQRSHNINVSRRLSFPLYQLPRRMNFSESHFCSYLTR